MKSILRALAGPLVLFSIPAVLPSCNKEPKAAVVPANRQPITPVTVEVRADGLAYLPGAATPFTGTALSAFPDAPWLVKMKEPYTGGKRDGDKLELFKNGKPKTLRRYDKGLPKYAASYHKNGQIKFELNLNPQDRGEGPYKRWYDDGTLESTAGLDAGERWHGEFKEWDRAGKLNTHHIFENGLLRQIILETPESQKAREAVGLKLEPAAPAVPAPGPAEKPPGTPP